MNDPYPSLDSILDNTSHIVIDRSTGRDDFLLGFLKETERRGLFVLVISSIEESDSIPKTISFWLNVTRENTTITTPQKVKFFDYDIVIYNGLIEDKMFMIMNKFIQRKVKLSIHVTDDMTNTERLACGRRIEHF